MSWITEWARNLIDYKVRAVYCKITTYHTSTIDPTTTDIPDGSFRLWKNTTTGAVKFWVNDGGILKSVTLS